MVIPESIGGGERSTQDWILEGVREPVPLYDAAFLPFSGGFNFELFQLGSQVLQLLLDTSEFRTRALSYRGFKVAAGAWCLSDEGRRGRALGYNVKVDDTNTVNIHAEDLVLEKARAGQFNQISVMAIIGEPQEDHASGALTDTLHPCGRCRYNLSQSPYISERTLFVTARPDFTVIQFASLTAIMTAHEGGDVSSVDTFRFNQTPAILRPRSRNVWQIMPEQIDLIDSSDYDNTIGAYLTQRYFSMRTS